MPFDNTPFENDQTLTDLRAWRAQLAKGWCQFDMACRADGETVAPSDAEAVSWCAAGALIKVLGATDDLAAMDRQLRAWDLVADMLGNGCGVMRYNDDSSTTQADVLALVDRAIAHREKELAHAVR